MSEISSITISRNESTDVPSYIHQINSTINNVRCIISVEYQYDPDSTHTISRNVMRHLSRIFNYHNWATWDGFSTDFGDGTLYHSHHNGVPDILIQVIGDEAHPAYTAHSMVFAVG
jgi:hypothetical protein